MLNRNTADTIANLMYMYYLVVVWNIFKFTLLNSFKSFEATPEILPRFLRHPQELLSLQFLSYKEKAKNFVFF